MSEDDPAVVHGTNYRLAYPLWPYNVYVQEMGPDAFVGFVDIHSAGLGWHQLDGLHYTDYYRVRECAKVAGLLWLARHLRSRERGSEGL